jgi:hypothetical protein
MTHKSTKETVLKQKEELANQALEVAKEALESLQSLAGECSVRDLVSIFNSSIKAHRELASDIVEMTSQEPASEKLLAKEFDGRVAQLLSTIDKKGKD